MFDAAGAAAEALPKTATVSNKFYKTKLVYKPVSPISNKSLYNGPKSI